MIIKKSNLLGLTTRNSALSESFKILLKKTNTGKDMNFEQ